MPYAVDYAGESYYGVADRGYFVHNVLRPPQPPPLVVRSEAAASVTPDLSAVPARAVVQHARFAVTADAAGNQTIGEVAQVRAEPTADATSVVIVDFQGMRTVSALDVPGSSFESVQAWLGTKFDTAKLVSDPPAFTSVVAFPEVRTERLRLVFDDDVSAADVESGRVTLPTPPTDLEVLVNGTRAWFSPVAAASPDSSDHDFEVTVDLTGVVQAALDTGSLQVELRASSPGVLSITPDIEFLRTHDVAFADGPARTVVAAAEGAYSVDLPLPGGAGWEVHGVKARISADIGDERVVPALGPQVSDAAELVLAGGRSLFVRLGAALLAPLERLTAVRVPVGAEDGDAELAGAMHADVAGAPGEAVPDAGLAPVRVPAPVAGSAPAYVTMPLDVPLELTGERLWLAVHVARGSAVWPLAQAGTDPTADSELRWLAPSGVHRPLSAVPELPPMLATIRAVGEDDPNAPVPALILRVAGRADEVRFTPPADGADVELSLVQGEPPNQAPNPITPASQPDGPPDSLRLSLVAAAQGSYTLDAIRVLYRDPSIDGGSST